MLPQPKLHPLLGIIAEYSKEEGLLSFQQRTHKALGSDVFVGWLGIPWASTPMVFYQDPDLSREIMVTQNVPKTLYKGLVPLMGMSLLTSNGDAWKMRRRMVNPGFSESFLRSLSPTMNDRVCVWIDGLVARARSGQPIIDPHMELIQVTLDIIGLVGAARRRLASAPWTRGRADPGPDRAPPPPPAGAMRHHACGRPGAGPGFEHDFHYSDGQPQTVPEEDGLSLQKAVAIVLRGSSEEATNPFRWLTAPADYREYLRALKMFKRIARELVDVAIDKQRALAAAAQKDSHAEPTRPSSILALMAAQTVAHPDEGLSATDMMNEIITFLYASPRFVVAGGGANHLTQRHACAHRPASFTGLLATRPQRARSAS